MKVQFNDKLVDGQAVSFTPFSEPWSEYHLEDGSVVRFRATISRLIKLDERNPDGSTIYVCQSQNQMAVEEK
jgi:hypothetical protein